MGTKVERFLSNDARFVRCVREEDYDKLLAAAHELKEAAISYAGDTALHRDAWLWDKVHAYEIVTGEAGQIYECSSEVCPWRGTSEETVSPKHDSGRLLCPECREVVERSE